MLNCKRIACVLMAGCMWMASTSPFTVQAAETGAGNAPVQAVAGGPVERPGDCLIYQDTEGVPLNAGDGLSVGFDLSGPRQDYQLVVHYRTVQGKGLPADMVLEVGEQSAGFQLTRIYKDIYTEDSKRPVQEEQFADRTAVALSSGSASRPVCVNLDAGAHTAILRAESEPVVIHELWLRPASAAPLYADQKAAWDEEGFQDAASDPIKVQAEDTGLKSDAMLYPSSNVSSVFNEPVDPAQKLLNVIDGNGWKIDGQWISWTFTCKEAGYYRMALRYRQSFTSGQTSYRRILIDGQVLFAEHEAVAFPYSSDWKILSPGGDGCLVYLSEGEHTLEMQATAGGMQEILDDTNGLLLRCNEVYRQILMMTGPNPDRYRDYDFDIEMPDTIAEIRAVAEELQQVLDHIVETAGRGASSAAFQRLITSFSRMAEEPERIASIFYTLKEDIAALGTWLTSASEQPLTLDYILFQPPEESLPEADGGFFSRLWFELQKLFYSFFADGSEEEGAAASDSESDMLNVWISDGRDQMQALQQLLDNQYPYEEDIPVKLSLIPAGALLPSTLAGSGPDVALSVLIDNPVNFGLRGAAVDLTQMPGFDEVASRFHDSAIVPYRYQGKVYALPQTQTFPVMFVRNDILESMGLSVPETWDDLYAMLPTLQKQYMEVGVPVDASGFSMFLLQQDGGFYNEEGTVCIMDQGPGYEAAREWTDFFSAYGMPLTYNFANRFRSGQLPIGIADYGIYNTLQVFAPEIDGLWSINPIPGTMREDGTIDRSVTSSGTACMIMEGSGRQEEAWQFLSWFTSTDVQVGFGKALENSMGSAARYATANLEAVSQIPWRTADYKAITDQWQFVQGIQRVPGSYTLERNINFFIKKIVLQNGNIRESLIDYTDDINNEIARKCEELGVER